MKDYFIGLMSGTSMDGVDGVLVDFSEENPHIVAVQSAPLAPELRAELLALNTSGTDELHRAALAGNALARTYAQVVQALLANSGVRRAQVQAIGAHGQTLRHRPQMFDATGYTLQLNNPALLAELTGIDVVADFRSRDVAAGGQGAPLAPFFHRAWFASAGLTHNTAVGVLNIGGISNLSIISADHMLGFDCGPGNALMDMWCQQHMAAEYDAGGAWAAGGHVHADLLASMLSDPYFSLPPPKSTGRDLFSAVWLEQHLRQHAGMTPQNVQTTLLELTARAIGDCVSSYEKDCALSWSEVIVCGGGTYNTALMQRLQALLPHKDVISSETRGLPPLEVEAAAFAWLAQQNLQRTALPLTSVTGALAPRILGCLYPA